MKFKSKNNSKLAKKILSDEYDYDFENIDWKNGILTIKHFNNLSEMIKWLDENTASLLRQVPDFENLFDYDYNVDIEQAIDDFEYYANKQNEEKMNELIEKLAQVAETDEDTDLRTCGQLDGKQ